MQIRYETDHKGYSTECPNGQKTLFKNKVLKVGSSLCGRCRYHGSVIVEKKLVECLYSEGVESEDS